MGNFSDLPNTPVHMYQSIKHGETKINSMGLFLHYSVRRTHLTGLWHKTLISTCVTWKMVITFSDFIIAERNHRYNQRMSESKPDNYPTSGHYDSWMIVLFKMLVLEHHNECLCPEWSTQ